MPVVGGGATGSEDAIDAVGTLFLLSHFRGGK